MTELQGIRPLFILTDQSKHMGNSKAFSYQVVQTRKHVDKDKHAPPFFAPFAYANMLENVALPYSCNQKLLIIKIQKNYFTISYTSSKNHLFIMGFKIAYQCVGFYIPLLGGSNLDVSLGTSRASRSALLRVLLFGQLWCFVYDLQFQIVF